MVRGGFETMKHASAGTSEKLNAIREVMIEWREEYGASVYITLEQLSEKTGIPVGELYDDDYHTGLCIELRNVGFLVQGGHPPHWQISGSAISYDGF